MANRIRIGCLADHQDCIPEMTTAFIEAWPEHYGPRGRGAAGADILSFCHQNRPPIGLVALSGARFCGSAALRASTESHAHLGPWLTALLVVPEFRRQGIGSRLIRAVEKLADALGYAGLYARTGTAVALFDRLEWTSFDTVSSGDQRLTVFRRDIAHPCPVVAGSKNPLKTSAVQEKKGDDP